MKKLSLVLSHALVAVVAIAATLIALAKTPFNSYTKLEQLQDLITDKFIGETDTTAMEDAAADAMVNALGDRWSYYISADDFAAYQEQMKNAYVGIGVTIVQRQDGMGLDVKAVTEGGPAEAAGILTGDTIVEVAGNAIAGMDVNAVRDLIRGKAGTTVQITVQREGVQHAYSVIRQEIQTQVAKGEMLRDNIGLVVIENFDARCADETIAAIESLLNQGAQKLIFDVRNNPGGYKDELVKVLDYLLPEGVIFHSEYYNGKVEKEYSDAKCLDMPMAVLVNGNSYSAAEFFAVALREYDKATVVGEQTCGKGYFQSTYQLQDGSAVGLSIGKYFTPKGENLAGIGVTPDVTATVDQETAAAIQYNAIAPEDDPQIQAAVTELGNG